jgi:hypothetical protein
MPSTYDKIATYTASGTPASYTFSSIPATYTDLRIVFNGGVTSGNINLRLEYNGDTGSNYSNTDVTGDGSSATSHRTANTTSILVNYNGYMNANQNTNMLIDIMNYANTTTYKTNLARANNAGNGVDATVGLWRSTVAINTVKVLASGGNFSNGSTFALYGIKAA